MPNLSRLVKLVRGGVFWHRYINYSRKRCVYSEKCLWCVNLMNAALVLIWNKKGSFVENVLHYDYFELIQYVKVRKMGEKFLKILKTIVYVFILLLKVSLLIIVTISIKSLKTWNFVLICLFGYIMLVILKSYFYENADAYGFTYDLLAKQ